MFSQIRVDCVDPERAYKICPDIFQILTDQHFFEKDFEVEEVELINEHFGDNVYLFPVLFINEDLDEANGYVLFSPWYKESLGPDYIIGSNNELVDLKQNEFSTNSPQITFRYLVNARYLQNRSDYYSLQNSKSEGEDPLILWAEFKPAEIVPNVGYQFRFIGREEVEYDPDEIKNEKIITGEMDPDDPLYVVDSYDPIYGLERTDLTSLPTEGFWWYLPVNIIFNEMQSILGYALFDVGKYEVIDLHFWNPQYGQISAMFKNKGDITLEDCGFFKNDKLFQFKILVGPVD